jgi:Holliday junction resolvasome RuvABC endonuclease subunit
MVKRKSSVMACDCSSKLIGISLLEKDKIKTCTIYGGDKNDFETRLKVMFKEFNEYLNIETPTIIYIEQAVYLQNVKATLMIDATINLVRFICISRNIPYQIVDNSSWKKDVLGNGKASKEQIMEFAKVKWSDHKFGNQDEADAACLAFYGFRRLE